MALVTIVLFAAADTLLAQHEPAATPSPTAPNASDEQAPTSFGMAGDEAWSAVEPELPVADESSATAPGQNETSGSAAESPAGRTLKRARKGGLFLRSQAGDKPSGNTWLRTTGALAGVVALIFLLGWGYRAVAGGRLSFAGRVKRPGVIEVISRTTLSPRHSLHLVRLGQRMVLVGMSNDRLVALDVVDDAGAAAQLAGNAAGQRAGSPTSEFSQLLEREGREYGNGDDAVAGTALPEERRLFDLKQQLAGTIRRVRAAVSGA